jgi:hypothetical protein
MSVILSAVVFCVVMAYAFAVIIKLFVHHREFEIIHFAI